MNDRIEREPGGHQTRQLLPRGIVRGFNEADPASIKQTYLDIGHITAVTGITVEHLAVARETGCELRLHPALGSNTDNSWQTVQESRDANEGQLLPPEIGKIIATALPRVLFSFLKKAQNAMPSGHKTDLN